MVGWFRRGKPYSPFQGPAVAHGTPSAYLRGALRRTGGDRNSENCFHTLYNLTYGCYGQRPPLNVNELGGLRQPKKEKKALARATAGVGERVCPLPGALPYLQNHRFYHHHHHPRHFWGAARGKRDPIDAITSGRLHAGVLHGREKGEGGPAAATIRRLRRRPSSTLSRKKSGFGQRIDKQACSTLGGRWRTGDIREPRSRDRLAPPARD